MDILTFYEELKRLTDRYKDSTDPAVMHAAVILLALQGALIGENVDGLQALTAAAAGVSARAIEAAAPKEVPS